MDYTNFIRTFYRVALNKLNKYTTYKGEIAEVEGNFEFGSSYHVGKNNLDVLPDYELNINSSVQEFEKYFDYISATYPSLSSVILSVEALREAYNLIIANNLDDEKSYELINILTDVGIDILLEKGVITNNGNEIK